MRDDKQIATGLRELADKYEAGHAGAFSFNVLGDVFGNEFWNLILFHSYDIVDKLADGIKGRLKGGLDG